MMEDGTTTLDSATGDSGIDIGRPVEWLIDPGDRSRILGITYEFSASGTRKTVWYTANKRRPKYFQAVAEMMTD